MLIDDGQPGRPSGRHKHDQNCIDRQTYRPDRLLVTDAEQVLLAANENAILLGDR